MHERHAPCVPQARARIYVLRCNDGSALHPAVGALCDDFDKGEVERRSFLRTLAWLGVSLASARLFCGDLTLASGQGTVYSYTVSHRGPGAFDADVPYAIVLGELAERPRPMLVLGNLVNFPVDQISIGMPIRISYLDVPDEDVTLWQWQAAG